MINLKIKVTKEVLFKSRLCGSDAAHSTIGCAVALAIRDIFPLALVWSTDIYPFGGTTHNGNRIFLPKEATYFINRFDELEPEERVKMPEIEFEINIPDSAVEKINIEELRPLLENHSNLELMP